MDRHLGHQPTTHLPLSSDSGLLQVNLGRESSRPGANLCSLGGLFRRHLGSSVNCGGSIFPGGSPEPYVHRRKDRERWLTDKTITIVPSSLLEAMAAALSAPLLALC